MMMNLQSTTMFAAAAFLLSPAALAETRNFDLCQRRIKITSVGRNKDASVTS